jgi:hypothetical protein
MAKNKLGENTAYYSGMDKTYSIAYAYVSDKFITAP